MSTNYLNRCMFRATSSGSGSFVVSAAIAGFRTPEGCLNPSVTDGFTYLYFAESDDKSEWEVGLGVYTTADDTLTRATILDSSNSGSVVTFTAAPKVAMGPPLVPTVLPSFRNIMGDNGGCEIWQRGAGGSASIAVAASTTAYTADRWYLTTLASEASVVSQQTGLDSQYCARVQRNSGQTGTGVIIFAYPLTTDECVKLRGKRISLSGLLRGGANFSPTSGTVTYNVYFGTGSEGKRGAGFTGETNPITGTIALTADGATIKALAVSGSATVATNVAQGEVRFTWNPTGTASTNDWAEFDNIQLEANAYPTDFEVLTFIEMLAGCQRHYCKTFPYGTAPASNAGASGSLWTTADGDASTQPRALKALWRFPVPMRTSPTLTTYNPSAAGSTWRNFTTSLDVGTAQTNTNSVQSADSTNVSNTSGGSASVAFDSCGIHVQADAGL